jgi:hypothetical protein
MSQFVPVVAPISRAEIAEEAKLVIARFRPRLLIRPGRFPVLKLFDALGDPPYNLESGVEELSSGVEGMVYPDGRVLVNEETYRGADNEIGRPRFTVSHECYHGMKHSKQIRRALTDVGELVVCRRQNIKPFLDPEWQANEFAGALLMPEQMVRLLAGKERRVLLAATMAEAFGVSTQAAEVRLNILKI